MKFDGKLYFPAFVFYPQNEFGLPYRTRTDYVELLRSDAFQAEGNWAIKPLIPHDPLRPNKKLEGEPPHPPGEQHWLGTDRSGRDVLARIIWGFRNSMMFALILVVLSALFGIVIGAIQGYFGGWTDMLWQRFIEVWAALPFLYIVILIGAVYGRNFWLLVFVMALFNWIPLSYLMRGEFFRLKNNQYVAASKTLGAGTGRIVFRQILPNALGPAITLLPFTLVSSITALTALDFLGFGLPQSSPSWGRLLDEGLQDLKDWWLTVSAVGALFVTLLLATYIGEGVRAAFDPKGALRIR